MPIILEAVVNNLRQALLAQKLGANRIELCTNLAQGGTTPDYGTIKLARQLISIPIIVMIRTHGNYDFSYTQEEIQTMVENIKLCQQLKIDGIGFCFLTKDKKVDYPTIQKLMIHATGLQTHFLMGFDQIQDQFTAIDHLVSLGITRILTKGGNKDQAIEQTEQLKRLVEYANQRIDIIVGGKVTNENWKTIHQATNATQFHGKLIVNDIGE